ncbi:MAG: carbohydrate kinase family protein [Patescibacteria group bacterium]|nr:carbohydrate kinase family protein [Patescibacteria group bacterium]
MKRYDIITFGSASEDVFVFSKKFFDKNLCFPVGDKIEMDKIISRSGGGGVNTATTFAMQGFKVAYCGNIGKDYAGFSILSDLQKNKISEQFLKFSDSRTTNHSVILSKKKKGKAILVYRDASNYLPKGFNLRKMRAGWFYLAPLGGEFAKTTKKIIDFANKKKIKIAFNPSKEQIKKFKKDIKNWLPKIDVLLPNEREAKMLFGDYKKAEDLFRKIKPYLNGIIVTGDNKKSIAFDGKNIYRAEGLKVTIADKTGSGDAFDSGFISSLIKTNNIKKSLQFATANAAACVQDFGAKEGLLKKRQKYKKVKVTISKLT